MKNKANSNQLLTLFLMIFLLCPVLLCAQNNKNDKLADKPLFRDPIYDGAADPTIIWNSIGIYSSEDFINWKRQEKNILQEPGKGLDDNVIGGHPDIVVNGERAYIFYFTHPGRTIDNRGKDDYQTRRSSIQVAELEYADGQIICNRDEPVYINLSLPNK